MWPYCLATYDLRQQTKPEPVNASRSQNQTAKDNQ